MRQSTLCEIINDQTDKALWELKNIIDCVPDKLWDKNYCEMPLYKHIYHTLHSLDRWFINPKIYTEPDIHINNLNNLDIETNKYICRNEINEYYDLIKKKIYDYLSNLNDVDLLTMPDNCEYTKFKLILAQFRHLHTHMGMIMGFIIDDTGMWPTVLGLENNIPEDNNYNKFY